MTTYCTDENRHAWVDGVSWLVNSMKIKAACLAVFCIII